MLTFIPETGLIMIITTNTLIQTFFIWPFIEYEFHYTLHSLNENRHKDHHILVHKNNFRNFDSFDDLEYFYYILPLLYWFNFPILFLGSGWYFFVHTIIHYKPELLPELSKHHLLHHKYPHCNFGVTNMVLDKTFGTFCDKQTSQPMKIREE